MSSKLGEGMPAGGSQGGTFYDHVGLATDGRAVYVPREWLATDRRGRSKDQWTTADEWAARPGVGVLTREQEIALYPPEARAWEYMK